MAHNIESNYTFAVGKEPWHKIGHVLTEAPTPAEAWKLAYPHNLMQVGVSAQIVGDDGSIGYLDSPEHTAIVRDDGKVLGVHSTRYGLTQPAEVFERFAPLIDTGLVQLETGGSLNDGKKMWALGRVVGAEADIIPGDSVKGFLLFQTSFDGSCTAGVGFTPIRVVCANTLAMAQGDISYRTKHTKNVNDRLDSYRDQIAETLVQFKQNVEVMRFLASKSATRREQETYIRHVIAGPESLNPETEISTKLENKVQDVISLLDTQRGLELVPAIRGTRWQAYNAVTDYLTHHHGISQDTRLVNQWFGPGVAMNKAALNLALSM